MSTASLMATVGNLAGTRCAPPTRRWPPSATAVVVGTALGHYPGLAAHGRVGRERGASSRAPGSPIAGGPWGAGDSASAASGSSRSAASLLRVYCSAFGQLYRFGRRGRYRGGAGGHLHRAGGGRRRPARRPQLARLTAGLSEIPYVASFLAVPLLALVDDAFLSRASSPAVSAAQAAGPARPLSVIVRQPIFLAAVVSQLTGYGVMNLLMTGTPLAMTAYHGHGLGDAVFVIQWHMVGMFLPGFFTGALIQRIGERATILLGIGIKAASLVVAFTGVGVWHFWLALTFLGVGWNLMFVGGSTLVTRTYTSAERAKAQAANDFTIWATVAVTSLSSGQLLHRHGWDAVVTTAVPILGLALAAVLIGRWRAASGPPGYHGAGPSPGAVIASGAETAAASGKGQR